MDHPKGASETGGARLSFDRRVRLEFHGSKISSDGGLLLLRELDEVLGLHDIAGGFLRDTRTGRNRQLSLVGLLRQSVFAKSDQDPDQSGLQDRKLRSDRVSDARTTAQRIQKACFERKTATGCTRSHSTWDMSVEKRKGMLMSQETTLTRSRISAGSLTGAGIVVGAVGGLAEVIWVSVIAPLTNADAVAVAQGVTETVFPALAGGPLGVALGLVIHFALAVALGLAVAVGVRRVLPALAGSATEFALVVGLLAMVWLMNFMVVLPAVNPAFVSLLPLWASFVSKLLFGVTAALALRMSAQTETKAG